MAERTDALEPGHSVPSEPGTVAAAYPVTDIPVTDVPVTDALTTHVLTTGATRTVAIHGLGGIGKSTVALHYASGYRAAYPLVWWITATAPAAIEAGLASLAVRLAPLWAREATTEERVAWSLTWLQWHPGWLLVFDNVENPADLRPYLGALSGGHALAISRRATGWHTIGAALPLGPLAPAASTDLLCALAYSGRTPAPAERHAAAALADELGHLPLALEQAGSYIHQTGKDMDAYRRGLRRMLAKRADAIEPEGTVARIWEHTLRAVTARDPLAVSVLNTVAWLAPDDIPRDLALGDTHPYTLGARSNLAYAYRQGNELTRAAELLESLLSDSDQVLGALHPDTFDTRAGLARVHDLSGDTEQAARIFADLLPLYERVLGDAHPSTSRARAALDRLRITQP